jgi:hypothetical protein
MIEEVAKMAEPKVKTREERERQIRNDMLIMGVISGVHILLWGWLTSIDAVAWLRPFLLQGAILFVILCISHAVMWDMLQYGFKQ